MGMTAKLIKRYLSELKVGEIFTRRHIVAYGEEKTVDKCTSRLVKRGAMSRLAFGVYCKGSAIPKEVTPKDIVLAKMRAWGKTVWTRDDKSNSHDRSEIVFETTGRSTSFKLYSGVKIVLHGSAPRKMKCGNSPAGHHARRLWREGQDTQIFAKIDSALMKMQTRPQRSEFLSLFKLMPGWLNDWLFVWRVRQFGADLNNLQRPRRTDSPPQDPGNEHLPDICLVCGNVFHKIRCKDCRKKRE